MKISAIGLCCPKPIPNKRANTVSYFNNSSDTVSFGMAKIPDSVKAQIQDNAKVNVKYPILLNRLELDYSKEKEKEFIDFYKNELTPDKQKEVVEVQTNYYKQNLLHILSKDGRQVVLESLADKPKLKAKLIEKTDKRGRTPLCYGEPQDQFVIAKEIIDNPYIKGFRERWSFNDPNANFELLDYAKDDMEKVKKFVVSYSYSDKGYCPGSSVHRIPGMTVALKNAAKNAPETLHFVMGGITCDLLDALSADEIKDLLDSLKDCPDIQEKILVPYVSAFQKEKSILSLSDNEKAKVILDAISDNEDLTRELVFSESVLNDNLFESEDKERKNMFLNVVKQYPEEFYDRFYSHRAADISIDHLQSDEYLNFIFDVYKNDPQKLEGVIDKHSDSISLYDVEKFSKIPEAQAQIIIHHANKEHYLTRREDFKNNAELILDLATNNELISNEQSAELLDIYKSKIGFDDHDEMEAVIKGYIEYLNK